MLIRTFDKDQAKEIIGYAQILIPFALLTLLIAGCGGGETPDGSAGQSDEVDSPIRVPTALTENLIGVCEESTAKLDGRKEAYRSIGNTRGEQLMEDSATKTTTIQEDASKINAQLESASGAGKAKKVNLVGERGDGRRDNQQNRVLLAAVADPQKAKDVTSAGKRHNGQRNIQQEQALRATLEEINTTFRGLESNINEAKTCCGLEPDFLNNELRDMRNLIDELNKAVLDAINSRTVSDTTGPSTVPKVSDSRKIQDKADPRRTGPETLGPRTTSKGSDTKTGPDPTDPDQVPHTT